MSVLTQNLGLNWPMSLKRLFYILIPLFLLLLLLNKASLSVIAAIILITLTYAYAREHIWILLALSIPTLVFGEIIYIPITINWVYEARVPEILLFFAAAVYFIEIYLSAAYERVKFDKICFLLLSYLFLSLASFAYIKDPRLFIFGIKVPAFGFLAYFLVINLFDNYIKIKAFFYGVAVTIVVLSAQVFVKFYQMGFSTKFFFERNLINIPIGPIATTSAILAMLVLVGLGFYFQLRTEKDRYAPFVLIACGVGFLAVFLTLGKAAIASLLIGAGYVFLKIKPSRTPLILFGSWFIVMAYLFLNPYLGGLFERIQNTLVDTNTKFRVQELETSWSVIRDNYLVGVGSGQQLYYFKNLLEYSTGQAQLVNNYFLQAMIDLGLVGLIFFLLLFIEVKKLVANHKNTPAYLRHGFIAAMICVALNGLFEVTIYALPYAICLWLLLGAFKNLSLYEKASRDYHQL